MLYHLLRQVFRLAVHIYFRKAIRQLRVPIPKEQPLLIVANHTSGLMDAILLAVLIDRPLHFVARGESFDKAWKRWLWSLLHMIPIYRREHTPELVSQNDSIFDRCSQLLREGKALMIFPEGKSKVDKRLGKVKTGAARIILRAAAQSHYQLPLAVLPMSINYSDPHRFRSVVLVKGGDVLSLSKAYAIHRQDAQKAVKLLTHQIETQLSELLVHAPLEAILEHSKTGNLITRMAQHAPSYFQLLGRELVVAYAYLNHCWMLMTTKWLADRVCRRPDFYGTLLLSFGTLVFLVCYGVQLVLVYWWAASVVVAVVYIMSVLLSGVLALRFLESKQDVL